MFFMLLTYTHLGPVMSLTCDWSLWMIQKEQQAFMMMKYK